MDTLIAATTLSLRYPGAKRDALAGLDFSVRRGEIFGLLGPSGAGKSTLQRILSGSLRGYRGSVQVGGAEIRGLGREYCETIGVDFEFPNFYLKFSGRDNLAFFASLYRSAPRDLDEWLGKVGLAADADKPVSSYSKGMKMRLGFVRAVLHRPRLLFLDEPTSGLDPANARALKDLIRAERDAGATVILTTHNMHDAAELCDRVAFIVDGRVMALDTPAALGAAATSAGENDRGVNVEYAFTLEGSPVKAVRPLAELGADAAFRSALDEGRLLGIHSQERSLEDVFIELTGRSLG
jgi:fluoroquinolone transport system ATP-binding protein